jgi:site-specific DNA-methyltransferase (adenine-specific)/modification methylase
MSDPWKRKEVIGDCTLYLGDCLEVMPALGKVDAVVTDPPYGIGFGKFNRTNKDAKGNRYKAEKYKQGAWDDDFDFTPFYKHLKGLDVPLIVWGGNYFPCLWEEGSKGFIFWHKHQPVANFSKGELAWSNINMPAKFIDFPYFGGIEGRTKASEKHHPTQKPTPVMQECLGFLLDAETILDPFMGSGTTLVACAKLGRKGIGIELDPDYFEIACKRVEDAYRQPDLFVAPPARPVQEGMDI